MTKDQTESVSGGDAPTPEIATAEIGDPAIERLPEPVAVPVAPWLRKKLWFVGFRRMFLINKRRQLKTIAMILVPLIALLIVMNVILDQVRVARSHAIANHSPELTTMLEGIDHREFWVSILISALIVWGAFFVALIETHRTEGAAFNIRRQLHRLGNGDLSVELRLRRNDHLHEMIVPFNRAVSTVRKLMLNDAMEIEKVAWDVEALDDGEEVAEKLRKIAARRRKTLDL